LTELKVKLAEYANLYRDKNPKMIRLKDQITETEIALKKERTTDLDYQKKGIDYVALKREVETNNSLYQIMSNRLKEISISGELKVNNIRIKDRSVIPSSPIRPKKALNILLSIVVGLIGGSGLAFFCNYFDRRIKDSDTLEKDLGLPLLGGIGVITNSKCRGIQREMDKAWHVTRYPISHITEEFRAIRTNIYFALQGKHTKKSIAFTSYGPGEGKTLASFNVAQALACGESKTLLVDADFRRPKIHTFFNCDNNIGLSTFLQDKTDLDNIINKTNLPNLYIVTSGVDGAANGGNPFELLNSQRMWDFVKETTKIFDRIIYDLPPFGIVNDAFILSSITKSVVLVIEYNKINREKILYARQLFEKLKIEITGGILNKCPISKDSYYYNYYNYHKRYDAQDRVFHPDIEPKLITQSKQK
jgi:capsular exopolysaccharide synthesis family protein